MIEPRVITRDQLDLTRYEIKDNKIFSKMIQDFIKSYYHKNRAMNYYFVHHNKKNYRIFEDQLY